MLCSLQHFLIFVNNFIINKVIQLLESEKQAIVS